MLINPSQAHQARLLVAITFHYRKQRLQYLFQVIKSLSCFPIAALDIVVATNTIQAEEIESIKRMCGPLVGFAMESSTCFKSIEVRSFPGLINPLHLPWAHKHLILDQFLNAGGEYTHYLYLEGDIEFSFTNFLYFLKYRPPLRRLGLLPSFLRVEYGFADDQLYCTDQVGIVRTDNRPVVKLDGLWFVNVDNPYNAMFMLDDELAREYVTSRSFGMETSSDVHRWDVRERAAMGLCFENVPNGFFSRYVIPINPIDRTVPSFSYLYHTPNNYANDPDGPFGKILMTRLFLPGGRSAVAAQTL